MPSAEVYATIQYNIKFGMDIPNKTIKENDIQDFILEYLENVINNSNRLQLNLKGFEENSLDIAIDDYNIEEFSNDEFDEFDELFDC